jgi:hypothetical protein
MMVFWTFSVGDADAVQVVDFGLSPDMSGTAEEAATYWCDGAPAAGRYVLRYWQGEIDMAAGCPPLVEDIWDAPAG